MPSVQQPIELNGENVAVACLNEIDEQNVLSANIVSTVEQPTSATSVDSANHEKVIIEVIECSTAVIRSHKETIWLIINHALSDVNVFVDIGTRLLPVERLKIYQKLIIFSLPTLVLSERAQNVSPKLLLRNGTQQIELPIQIAIECAPVPALATTSAAPGSLVGQDAQMGPLFEFATEGDPLALLKPLIPLIALTDCDGCNVLHIAARNKQNFALKMLLSAVCSASMDEAKSNSILNARNVHGQTALHCAVRAGDADCVHYLIGAGARTDIEDNDDNTVVHYLGDVYNEAIYKDIIETCASQLQNCGGEANSAGDHQLARRNRDGHTPAHIAVQKLKLGLLEALAEVGAPLDVADKNGRTPLINALLIDDTDAVSLLINHNCNVNASTVNGDTPLKIACRNKNLVLIGRLLDAGAHQDTTDINEASVIDEDVLRILNGERVEIADTADENGFDNEENDGAEFFGSSSTATSNYTSASNQLRSIVKDDIACVDYLTRLRLSKLLDADDKWTTLADRLGCGHMVQYIRVCLDSSSSPTMIFLDQYEQIPGANVTTVAQSLEDMGEKVGARLLRAVPD